MGEEELHMRYISLWIKDYPCFVLFNKVCSKFMYYKTLFFLHKNQIVVQDPIFAILWWIHDYFKSVALLEMVDDITQRETGSNVCVLGVTFSNSSAITKKKKEQRFFMLQVSTLTGSKGRACVVLRVCLSATDLVMRILRHLARSTLLTACWCHRRRPHRELWVI